MRRVVVTGLGLVTPLGAASRRPGRDSSPASRGAGRDHALRRLRPCLPDRLRGASAATAIDGDFDPDKLRRSQGPAPGRRLHPLRHRRRRRRRSRMPAGSRHDRGGARAHRRARSARASAACRASTSDSLDRCTRRARAACQPVLHPRPPDQPDLAARSRSNTACMGPNHAVVTACSTGAHAIGDAARMIAFGRCRRDAGGRRRGARSARSASPASPPARALSTSFNDTPEQASRPYDKDRDGFVMGEGAGVVVLEEYEHAKARGAKIYAEVDRLRPVGRRLSRHRAASEDGDGAFRCDADGARSAPASQPSDIDYINAHGTSTPLGDEIELGAVERLFGDAVGQAVDVARPSRRSAICSAAPARSRRSSASSRCATRSCRRRSTSTIPIECDDGDRPRAASRPRSARSRRRCPTASASAAPTPRSSCAASTEICRDGLRGAALAS